MRSEIAQDRLLGASRSCLWPWSIIPRRQPPKSAAAMEFAEFFVTYLQEWLPTWFILWLLRVNLKYVVGWRMRLGDAVVQQIACDRLERKSKPVTEQVDVTNEQLYANDPDFFVAHLGPRLKYSACEFPTPTTTLAEAETYTIAVYQDKAGLAGLPKGARVLELGCGWGSLSLSNAERFPHLTFVGFSNSPQQIGYIRDQAAKKGLSNLTVFVEDYSLFVDASTSKVAPPGAPLFDAAVAIETIEHAQNIGELLGAVALRLKPGAKLFVQTLLHQTCSYVMGDTWMGRNFFTAGSVRAMPTHAQRATPVSCLRCSGSGARRSAPPVSKSHPLSYVRPCHPRSRRSSPSTRTSTCARRTCASPRWPR